MDDLKNLFSFSRGELIALVALMVLALGGGGILLFQRTQEQIPADVVFYPLEPTESSNVVDSRSEKEPDVLGSTEAQTTHQRTVARILRVNINTAPPDSLMLLPHVGKVISARIVAYRQARGGFDSTGQLIAVRGIGPSYLRDILPYVSVD